MPTGLGPPCHGLEKADTANGWLATGGHRGLCLNQFIIKQGRACCLVLRARDVVRITSPWLPGLPKSSVASRLWKKPCSWPKLCQGRCKHSRGWVTGHQACTWGIGIRSVGTGWGPFLQKGDRKKPGKSCLNLCDLHVHVDAWSKKPTELSKKTLINDNIYRADCYFIISSNLG